MSIYEWQLKQKPVIKFVRYLPQNGERNVWTCSNGHAGGWGHSCEEAYRAFKKRQMTMLRGGNK